MDLKKSVLTVVMIAMIIVGEFDCCLGNVVTLNVKHKFAGKQKDLSAMRAHDIRRHGRLLSSVAIDLPLGGDGQTSGSGLYFTKLEIGNPIKEYHVQVDTGSDILWLNCADCDTCPEKSSLGIELNKYDPKKSSSSSLVYCNNEFCSTANYGEPLNCKPDQKCEFHVSYGDGTSNAGYMVKDTVQLQQVSGNLQTKATNGTIMFGCGTKRAGNSETSSEAVDGIIGFGQWNSSVFSQLALSGKVKRKFAHCLDNVDGGGIFAIGEVVAPPMNKAPMIPKQSHYKVELKKIQIDDTIIKLSSSFFSSGEENGAIIDSGATLAYFPAKIYQQITEKIVSRLSSDELEKVADSFTCFKYDKNVDDDFPVVKFHFEDSLVLTVYPHDYLFQYRENMRCIGWQDSGSSTNQNMILLGDLALSNKLVIYDIEDQTIGWAEYNCSSNIKVKDEETETEHAVGAHLVSSTSSLSNGGILTLLAILVSLLHFSKA